MRDSAVGFADLLQLLIELGEILGIDLKYKKIQIELLNINANLFNGIL